MNKPQTLLATAAAAIALTMPCVAARADQGYTDWQRLREIDVMHPTEQQKPLADLWKKYGTGPIGPGAISEPLSYATFKRGDSNILAGIALGKGCDNGLNDLNSTQIHSVCPMVVIVETHGTYREARAPTACYMMPPNEPPSPETDPRTNATFMRMNEVTGQIEATTTRKGKPIRECNQKVTP